MTTTAATTAPPEPSELPIVYHDESQCWPYFRQLVGSLFPLKDIRFNFDIGEFLVKNFRPAFHLAGDPALSDTSSPIKAYRRPYVYLYLVTLISVQDFNENVKPKLEAFIAAHEKKPEGEEKDEWLIIYTTLKPISSEIEYKTHHELFNTLESNFREYNQQPELVRIISVFGFDQKVELFNVTFDGLYKFSLSFVTSIQNGIQRRVAILEDKNTSMLEFKDNESWNFLKFFALKENTTIIYENLKMHMQAFQTYEELRNKYYESILRRPDKLKFQPQEFYLIKGKENPYFTDMDREETRAKLFDNTISEFDFVQYLFARQTRLLKQLNWFQEGIERVKMFTSDIFQRATRELPEVQDMGRFTVFKHIWSIQVMHGFLEFFHPKYFTNDNQHAQNDLNYVRMQYKHHTIQHLEQLYGFLYGQRLDKVKVKSFSEEFEVLLNILEHGGVAPRDSSLKPAIDVSQFDIREPKLRDIIEDKDLFLEYIYEEKIKYTQVAGSSGCKKMAQFKNIECLKYRIEQFKIETVKVEEITAIIQYFDSIHLFEVSDVLRVYLMRIYIQKRNFSDLMNHFLSIYRNQSTVIQNNFLKNDKDPFKTLHTFCERNIERSFKLGKLEDVKVKELFIKVEKDKSTLNINYSIINELKFPINHCKVQCIIKPRDLKKAEDNSHKKQYQKYTWTIENLNIGENSNQVQLKAKNSGFYRIKSIFLKVSKFRFKVVLPSHVTAREFSIQEENKYTFALDHRVADNIMLDGNLPPDNNLPIILKLSDFSFRFDRVRVELEFNTKYTTFGNEISFFSADDKDNMLEEGPLEFDNTGSPEKKYRKALDIRPHADTKTLYIGLALECKSNNSEVWEKMAMKVNCYLKSSHVNMKEYAINLHFSPLLAITPRFYRLPAKSFLHIDLVNDSLYPLQINKLQSGNGEDLVEADLRIEPSEEFSAILDDPKNKEGSSLAGAVVVCDQEADLFKKAFADLPGFVSNAVKISSEFIINYNYGAYIEQTETQYRLEIDFQKAVLYHQSYIMTVIVSLLPGAERNDCEIIVNDHLNNWLFFGRVKYHLKLEEDKPTEVSFNLIPIKVGEIPLPKITVQRKKVQEKALNLGKKPTLAINLQEIEYEPECLSDEKLEVKFINSQMVQVFNNSIVSSERFSLM